MLEDITKTEDFTQAMMTLVTYLDYDEAVARAMLIEAFEEDDGR